MRCFTILCLTFLAALLLGCGPSNPSAPDPHPKTSNAAEKLKEAAEATTAAAQEQRDLFIRTMGQRLDELNLKYEELKTAAAKAEGQAKQDLEQKLEEARIKRDAAGQKLEELKAAGADRWEKVKEGVGNAFEDLKKVFE
jgi:TolA-binding protein